MPLFKGPEDHLQIANDRLLRGDFAGARDSYTSASQGYAKQGNGPGASMAAAYAGLMGLAGPTAVAPNYLAVAAAFAPMGAMPVKLGLRQVTAGQIALEAQLAAEEMTLASMVAGSPAVHQEMGHRYQALSMAYRQMGDQVLVLSELFKRGSATAASKVPVYAARAMEEFGEAEVGTDPKRAAEHHQSARNWWLQAGDTARADAASQRVNRYAKSVRCWFCGREVTGEGVNFQSLTAVLGSVGLSEGAGQANALPACELAKGSVYACVACASAVDRVADAKALQRSAEAEARLNARIDELRRSIPTPPGS